MNRASNTPVTRHRRKKVLKQSKGSFGPKTFKVAKERVMRSLAYSYAHRKKRYPFFRSKVWIPRLNIHLRSKYGIRYSQFIRLLVLAQIKLNRKQLSEMAIHQPQHFDALVSKVQNPW